MSPDSRDVSLRYVGNSSSHREEIPNRRVWSQVLLPDVGLLNMLEGCLLAAFLLLCTILLRDDSWQPSFALDS